MRIWVPAFRSQLQEHPGGALVVDVGGQHRRPALTRCRPTAIPTHPDYIGGQIEGPVSQDANIEHRRVDAQLGNAQPGGDHRLGGNGQRSLREKAAPRSRLGRTHGARAGW